MLCELLIYTYFYKKKKHIYNNKKFNKRELTGLIVFQLCANPNLSHSSREMSVRAFFFALLITLSVCLCGLENSANELSAMMMAYKVWRCNFIYAFIVTKKRPFSVFCGLQIGPKSLQLFLPFFHHNLQITENG